MTVFRGCIDLHSGKVKQIVGGTLSDTSDATLKTNFVSEHPPSFYSKLYKDNDVKGTHVILLGRGNEEAAIEALQAWPQALQVGGGINPDNAGLWIERGADKVIVTSYLFPDGKFSMERLEAVKKAAGGKENLVIDVSCRVKDGKWIVAMDRWQRLTDMEVNEESIRMLEEHCAELLIHAADVEGLCRGIDQDLVKALGQWVTIPCTYAGGAKSVDDLKTVEELSNGKVDLTYGSALDIFGGNLVKFEDVVAWNKSKMASS